jgi:ubiquinone/menaquinone biosynthesis C-methylase UbiE
MDSNLKISEILLKYKSDKNQGLSESKSGHCYGPLYDDIFERFDRNSNLDILEIGIQKGGSLVAWKEYFQNANIWGIDIENQILDEYRNPDFKYIIHDVKSDKVKKELKNKKFDIIIDDGSHKLYDMMYVVDNFLVNLKPNGFLLIEDCFQPESWLWAIEQQIENKDYEIMIYDARFILNNIDDFIIVIKKK